MGPVSIYVVLLASLAALAHCYPSGTFIDSACSSMTPGHGVSPINSTSPYFVFVDRAHYQPGHGINVTFGSFNSTFKGFMIQARRANYWEDQTEMLGNFTVINYTNPACSWHALVHANSSDKTNVTVTWNPPLNSSGDIVFRVTFVQSKYVFWTNVESETVYDVARMQTSTMTSSTYSGPLVIYKYNYCGIYEGCFSDCNIYGCSFLVSWYESFDTVYFTLKSSHPASGFYMALGFSSDDEMGDDSVMGCAYQYGQYYKFTGKNLNRDGPVLLYDYEVQLSEATLVNDILTCRINRPVDGLVWRYGLNETWKLFFAKGAANVLNGDITLFYHQENKYISKFKASAYTKADLETMAIEDDDDVNANSAERLVQKGIVKILLIFALPIYYLAN